MVQFLVVLALLFVVNVWATRRVLAAPEALGLPKRMLLAGIWIIPFIGALIAKSHTPLAMRPEAVPSSDDDPPVPERLVGAGGTEFIVREHFGLVNGVPVLDWRALAEWAGTVATPEATAAAIDQGRRAWLLLLRLGLGPCAHLHVAEESCVLSTLEPEVVEATARYIATARRRVARVLGDLARFPAGERSILLVFDTEEDYYRYVSIYYPAEGEFAFSGGMFIDAGCPHFVVVAADLSSIEPVIAHELTHRAVSHLRLPKWLDEGLAVNTEHKVAGARRLIYTPQELHAMHQKFWNAERIQDFWSGRSFDRTDEGNMLSYELARIMVGQLAAQWQAFAAFVTSAKREDAGAGAAREHLDIRLGAYAAALLEMNPGQAWDPAPAGAAAG